MRRIIVDCDPGVDDAAALLFAVASSDELTIEWVTTVAGNCSVDSAYANARRVLAFGGRPDIRVAKGCSRPIMSRERRTTHVHGNDGLAGVSLPALPDESMAEQTHAVDAIIDTILASPDEITLCAIGPMTNIALAMIKEPLVCDRVREIVYMGGAAFVSGNVTPVASFNFYADPHAAQVVISSGVKLTMFGLDVTRKVHIRPEYCERLRRSGGIASVAAQMLAGYGAMDPSLHDPCVIGYLLDGTLFSGVQALVSVECSSPLTMGQSVAAVTARNLAGRAPNCTVITDVDEARLLELIATRLARLA